MKDEIKEILDNIKKCCDITKDQSFTVYQRQDILALLDYITNLQKENEKLKNGYCELKVKCNNGECDCTNEEYDGMVQANMKNYLLLEDYKSRNEKAIKMFDNETLNKYYYGMSYEFEINDFKEDMLNILQGSDKE